MPFTPISLGVPIPSSPHAVSCSLPTMRAIIGYEEKEPAVIRALQTGYPRFVIHPHLNRLREHYFTPAERHQRDHWFAGSERAAFALARRLGGIAAVREPREGVWVVEHPRDDTLYASAKTYLQMSGTILSSRRAEDLLLAEGLLEKPFPEQTVDDPEVATARIKGVLGRLHGGLEADRILLTCNGMNAFRETFLTVAESQLAEGRDIWIQLGWLYTDTMRILQEWKEENGPVEAFYDVRATEEIVSWIARHADRVAGLITEAPTNPLLQTADLVTIAEKVREAGGFMIVDPTLASPYVINVSPVADVIINSLTKYAGNGGDVMAGSIVFPPGSPLFAHRDTIARRCQPLYHRELSRLAFEVEDYEKLLPVMVERTRQIVDWLEKRPEVARVYWSGASSSAASFARLAVAPERVAPIFSFTLKKSLAPFFDRLPLPKGPSFGMRNSLVCPFMYLAHYDLVSQKDGQAFLLRCGMPIDLLRFAVGTEPFADIVEALEEGFRAYAG